MTREDRNQLGWTLQIIGVLGIPLALAYLYLMALGCGMATTGCLHSPFQEPIVILVILAVFSGLAGLIVWGGRMRARARAEAEQD